MTFRFSGGEDGPINHCPIDHPSDFTPHRRWSIDAPPRARSVSLFRPTGPLVSPAQASGLGTSPTQRLEGPTARPFAAEASDSPNGRPFRPRSLAGLVDQGRWPWLWELSGPVGLKPDKV